MMADLTQYYPYFWVKAINPTYKTPNAIGAGRDVWAKRTGDKLQARGFLIYQDEDGIGPRIDDQSDFIISLSAHWPDWWNSTHHFPDNDPATSWVSRDNLDALYDTSAFALAMEAERPGWRLDRRESTELRRDFPNPEDFNMIFYRHHFRTVFRIKCAMQIVRLAEFAQHGGRPLGRKTGVP